MCIVKVLVSRRQNLVVVVPVSCLALYRGEEVPRIGVQSELCERLEVSLTKDSYVKSSRQTSDGQ